MHVAVRREAKVGPTYGSSTEGRRSALRVTTFQCDACIDICLNFTIID